MNQWLKDKQAEMANKMGQEAFQKYNHPGIYAISLKDKIVYIGKSSNMTSRLIAHMIHIENLDDKCNKYIVLNEAQRAGLKIQFSVLSYCPIEELDQEEARLIRQYMPVLNYQIPKLDNPHRFEVQKRAKEISFEQLARELEIELG